MISNKSSTLTHILFLYGYILTKHHFFYETFFDLEFVVCTNLMAVLCWLHFFKDEMTEEHRDIGKFIGHNMLIYVILSIVSNIIIFIYEMFFVLGIINTFLILIILYSIFMIKIIPYYFSKIHNILQKSHLGRFLLNLVNYIYNFLFLFKKIFLFMELIYSKFAKPLFKFIIGIFYQINYDLSDNTQTKKLKININQGCQYIFNNSYFNDISKSFVTDMFMEKYDELMETQDNEIINRFFDCKKDLGLCIDIKKQKLMNSSIANEDIDDLEDLDISDAPNVSDDQIKQADELESLLKINNIKTYDDLQKLKSKSIVQDNESVLKKKLRNKQSARSKKTVKTDLTENPELNKMMAELMKGGNPNQIAKKMAAGGGSGINMADLKKLQQQMQSRK